MINFSVIIPLYNKERHIQRAVDSVLNQEYQNFDLIIVNDGSTDQSLPILAKYQGHPKIQIISQENKGECAARNAGIKNAKHDFIAFLDADDSWEPDFLSEILHLINCYPDCGIYATSFQRVMGSEKKGYKFVGIPFANEGKDGIIKDFFFSMACGQDPVTASSICIPKKIFNELGLFLEGTKQLQEDVEMWIRIALKYPIAFSGKICSNYHCDADNRACLQLSLKKDRHPVEKTINKALEEGIYPQKTVKWLKEYLSVIYFSNAVRCLAHHDPDLSRKLLKKVRTKNPILILKAKFIQAISFLPNPLTRALLSVLLPSHYKGMLDGSGS